MYSRNDRSGQARGVSRVLHREPTSLPTYHTEWNIVFSCRNSNVLHRRRRRAIDLLRLVADPDLRAGCKPQDILTKPTRLLPHTRINDKSATLTQAFLSTAAKLAYPTKRRICEGVGVRPRRPKRR